MAETTELIVAVGVGIGLGYYGGIALANYLNKPWRDMAARLDAIEKAWQKEGIEDVESKLIDALLRVANSGARVASAGERSDAPESRQD